ncbi:MAG: DUF2325 domain-containing protein [Mitsuaria chitosanitabida]|uniref:DUF2325 domain-containing protein n=1 Tax=Roseateles chitosanitabidus TaxID=65048 RepID=UPI001B2DFCAC|nr:DUF2325 domain-containing protein [Roseateles chitosanitabidus]MBO9687516.1 DUF2325 domain-containing protein [Roseateles chitosanitabidus]
MQTPPFKLSPQGLAGLTGRRDGAMAPVCCDHEQPVAGADLDAAGQGQDQPAQPAAFSAARMRLHQLDPHLHCSVIGNCLGSGELRRLMARHVEVKGMSDLDVHHLAVSMAAQGGDLSKALHKALDQRHAGPVRVFAAARDEAALEAAWHQAWQQGEIPGAYWALLSHKAVTPTLRQLAFGEVHMLSHLMGSANRHELKRFVTMEKDHAALEERLEREQQRRAEVIAERDRLAEQLREQALDFERRLAAAQAGAREDREPAEQRIAQVAMQTERRERAERVAEDAVRQLERLREQLALVQQHGRAQAEELAAAEGELQRLSVGASDVEADGAGLLAGRRILYVGGRPSSTPAIRDFVESREGEFLHHDGGLESRKGLLAALLPRVDLVVFPVDCIDHDSALNLKRLSDRHQVPFLALRSASLASFAASIRRELVPAADGAVSGRFCLRHG